MSSIGAIPDCPMDPRVRRTRQLLHQALFALLKEKSFEAVSVQDITDQATVNRATFYDHFSDKFALFDDIIAEQFHAALRVRFQDHNGFCPQAMQRLIETVCDFLSGIPSDCEVSASHKLLDLLTEAKVKAIMRDLLVKWLGAAKHYTNKAELELVATMTSSSIYAACLAWSKTRPRPQADKYAPTIFRWVSANLPS